jgi:4'-phosphopantetheinyl transferase EntD
MIKRSAVNADRCGGFRQLVPPSVVLLEQAVPSVTGPLALAEATLIERAVDKRRTEFTAGRVLARRAFVGLGVPDVALPADADGVPAWPPQWTGCITHACGRVAVAVAAREAVEGVGIDMEAVARFHCALEPHVLSPDEIRLQLAASTGAERQGRLAVLFCAKEAWFKCQFPLTRRRIGFHDAEVQVDWASGRFVVLPGAMPRANAGVDGRSVVHDGIARAAMALEAGRLSAAARRAWQLPAVP